MAIEKNNRSYVDDSEKLPRKYTKQALELFGARLKEFLEPKEIPSLDDKSKRETVMVLNMWRALEAFGAVRKKNNTYSVVLLPIGEDREGRTRYEIPIRYEVFMDKYEQWLWLQGKKAFGETARLKDYEKMAAENMSYVPDVEDDDEVVRLTPIEVDAKMELQF